MPRNAPDFGAFQQTVAELWSVGGLARRPGQAEAAAAKLMEEAGEVAREVLALAGWQMTNPAGLTSEEFRQQLEAEIGDMLFVLARLATMHRIDLGMAARVALEKFARRVATPPAAFSGQPARPCDVCGQAVEPGRRWELDGTSGHRGCIEAAAFGAPPPPPCAPGGEPGCIFPKDSAVEPGSTCGVCGWTSPGDAWEPPADPPDARPAGCWAPTREYPRCEEPGPGRQDGCSNHARDFYRDARKFRGERQ